MKKLLFVAALGVAGLMSAKGTAGDEKKMQFPEKTSETKSVSVTATQTGCFPFTLSCGIQGTACGDNTAELVSLILDADNAICGN